MLNLPDNNSSGFSNITGSVNAVVIFEGTLTTGTSGTFTAQFGMASAAERRRWSRVRIPRYGRFYENPDCSPDLRNLQHGAQTAEVQLPAIVATPTSNYTLAAPLACPSLVGSAVLFVSTGVTLDGSASHYHVSGKGMSPVAAYNPESPATDRAETCLSVLGDAATVTNVTVQGCRYAIKVNAAGTAITANIINNAGQYGIAVRVGTASITGNTVKGVFGYGIYVATDGNTVSGNTLQNNYTDINQNVGYAIYIADGVTGTTVTGNTLTDSRFDIQTQQFK